MYGRDDPPGSVDILYEEAVGGPLALYAHGVRVPLARRWYTHSRRRTYGRLCGRLMLCRVRRVFISEPGAFF